MTVFDEDLLSQRNAVAWIKVFGEGTADSDFVAAGFCKVLERKRNIKKSSRTGMPSGEIKKEQEIEGVDITLDLMEFSHRNNCLVEGFNPTDVIEGAAAEEREDVIELWAEVKFAYINMSDAGGWTGDLDSVPAHKAFYYTRCQLDSEVSESFEYKGEALNRLVFHALRDPSNNNRFANIHMSLASVDCSDDSTGVEIT